MPQTDIHKIVGYFLGVGLGYFAKWIGDVPADVQLAITLGVSILVSTWIGKSTNPTGANSSEARQVLEQKTGTGSGK